MSGFKFLFVITIKTLKCLNTGRDRSQAILAIREVKKKLTKGVLNKSLANKFQASKSKIVSLH